MTRPRFVPAAAASLLFAITIAAVNAAGRRAGHDLSLPLGLPLDGLPTVGLSFPVTAAIANGFVDAAPMPGAEPVVRDPRGGEHEQANDVDDLGDQRFAGLFVVPLDALVVDGWDPEPSPSPAAASTGQKEEA